MSALRDDEKDVRLSDGYIAYSDLLRDRLLAERVENERLGKALDDVYVHSLPVAESIIRHNSLADMNYLRHNEIARILKREIIRM